MSGLDALDDDALADFDMDAAIAAAQKPEGPPAAAPPHRPPPVSHRRHVDGSYGLVANIVL